MRTIATEKDVLGLIWLTKMPASPAFNAVPDTGVVQQLSYNRQGIEQDRCELYKQLDKKAPIKVLFLNSINLKK